MGGMSSRESHESRESRFCDTGYCSLIELPCRCTPRHWSQDIHLEEATILLRKDLEGNQEFQNLWTEAAKILEERFEEQDETLEDFKIALTAYTMNKLYGEFNQISRDMEIATMRRNWDGFSYKGWWCMLYHAMMKLRSSTDEAFLSKTCYRGDESGRKLADDEKVEYFAFSQFTSTSTSVHVALQFALKNNKTFKELAKSGKQFKLALETITEENWAKLKESGRKPEATVYEIDQIPLHALDIKKYSEYPKEEEILLAPWNTFKIVKTGKAKEVLTKAIIRCVYLSPTQKCSPMDQRNFDAQIEDQTRGKRGRDSKALSRVLSMHDSDIEYKSDED